MLPHDSHAMRVRTCLLEPVQRGSVIAAQPAFAFLTWQPGSFLARHDGIKVLVLITPCLRAAQAGFLPQVQAQSACLPRVPLTATLYRMSCAR